MAEEKKKKTTKQTTTKKNNNTTKKVKTATNKTPKKIEQPKKKEETKTVEKKAIKKEETKTKTTKQVKKETSKKVETKVEPKVEKKVENKEEKLERTIIFDGVQKRNLQEVVENLEKENVVLKDKVVKRSKINKYIVIFLIIAMLAVMTLCVTYMGINIKNELNKNKTEETLNTNIYNRVESMVEKAESEEKKENSKEEKAIVQITLKEFEQKILNKEDMNILVSSNSCYFCYNFEPIVEDVLTKINKKIYMIEINSLEKEELQKFRTYYAFTITPTIFTIKNGIVANEKTGTQTAEELEAWATENLV